MPPVQKPRGRSQLRACARLLPVLAVLASACQGILGIESWSQKTTSKPDAGSCILASDCSGSQVCLFQTCSEPCAKDKDCSDGEYCLRTNEGSACVSNEQAQCGTQDCPAGTVCSEGHCQATCDVSDANCPGGQQCTLGVCVSNVPDAGNGEGGTSNGGQSGAGEAGATAAAGGLGEGGEGGEGGTPPVHIDDGTAIGSRGTPCPNEGAFACSGHAQRDQLVCEGGTWQPNGTCAGTTRCDSTPGANAGSCQPLIPECQTQVAGYHFCRGSETGVRECGLDLVTAKVVDSCLFVCSAGACQGECHPTEKRCKAGGIIPQTCGDAGTWQDGTACAFKCDAPSGKCLSASCADKAKNGDETDIDCGGSCGGCGIDSECKADADCVAPESARCINNKCAAAACNDGVKNGTETDKDCGGACAQRCAVNQTCAVNGDCQLPDSGHCSATKCVPFSCLDGIKNGSETDKDCGGLCAADCAVGFGCGMDGDCATAACLGTACVACKPTTKACLNSSVQTCSATGTWGTPVPCTASNGTASCSGQGVCGVQACNAGFGNCDGSAQTGCETNLNDPAACGTTCANRTACSAVNATPACTNGACKPSCAPGYGDCNASTLNDGCERRLNVVSSCGTTCSNITTCTAPAQICTSGACVTNTPYTVGQASSSGWIEFNPPADTWFVVPVSVPKDATVQALRLIGLASGGSARMAIWADDGSGHPGAFVAQTANVAVVAGVNSAAPVPLATSVSGGKTYWVGSKFTGSPRLYQNSSPGAKGYTLAQSFGALPSALSPFPASPGTFSNTVLNFFLSVQDTPP